MSPYPTPGDEPVPLPATEAESATKRNPVPDDDAARLQDLRSKRLPESSAALDLLCAQLRKRGYTEQAIANAMGLKSRQAVNLRIKRVPAKLVANIEPDVSRIAPRPEPDPRPGPTRLTDEEVARLLELQPRASKRRAGTPLESPAGRANAEYVEILLAAHNVGVTDYMIAKQLGQTPRAITSKRERANGPLSMKSASPNTGRSEPLGGFATEVEHLRALLTRAEIGPGHGPLDPERLAASRDFDEALVTFIQQDIGVSLSQLATSLDRSRSALAMRIADFLGTPNALRLLDEPELEEDDDSSIDRPGYITDFTPENVPQGPPLDPSLFMVDPTAQRASTNAHMNTLRRLRTAVVAGGHTTTGWDVGQDACFTHGSAVVNVEVKSIGSGIEQYRLGVGQLAEQVQHHLDHMAAGSAWYRENGIARVVGILVVSAEHIPGVWRRLASRLGIAVWDEATAVEVFTDGHADALPVGVSVEDWQSIANQDWAWG